MIYTVTCNSAMDYKMRFSALELTKSQTAQQSEFFLGGKGVNVSIMLQNLGVTNCATGFAAGFTGLEFLNRLHIAKISERFIIAEGSTRVNVKLSSKEGETECNGVGLVVLSKHMQALTLQLLSAKKGDYVILSGSLPDRMSKATYGNWIRALNEKQVNCVLDTSGYALQAGVNAQPFLVKPNEQELAAFCHVKIPFDIYPCMQTIQQAGAKNVLLSVGANGAYLLTEQGMFLQIAAPNIVCRCSVGAGDSMLAAFVAHIIKNNDMQLACKYAVAAGSATARLGAIADRKTVEQLFLTM